MVEPHTPASFKDPKFPILAFSVDDEDTNTRELFGEMKQPPHKLNDVFDGLHDRTTQMDSLAVPTGINSVIADLRRRLSDQDQKHKDVITGIHGILDEVELLPGRCMAIMKKELEREIAHMDKLVRERVAECVKTYIAQELQDKVAGSNREPQHQVLPGSQLLHTGLPTSPRNPPSALQGPSTSTQSHTTITSPFHPPGPPALANSFDFTSPPPTSSTPSMSGANWPDVGSRAAAIKKTDGTEISLENSTKSTPTPSTVLMEFNQHKSRLAEQEQNDRLKAEAREKRREKKQRRKEQKEAEALELKRLKEKQDGQLEDGKVVDNETSMSMEDGKDKPEDGLRINTISINSRTSDKRSASRVVGPLVAARFIADIATVPYPEGLLKPHPDLNQNVKNGKFRYDREFLLQFMSVCKERPATLPSLDKIGLEPVQHTYKMSRGGPGLG